MTTDVKSVLIDVFCSYYCNNKLIMPYCNTKLFYALLILIKFYALLLWNNFIVSILFNNFCMDYCPHYNLQHQIIMIEF